MSSLRIIKGRHMQDNRYLPTGISELQIVRSAPFDPVRASLGSEREGDLRWRQYCFSRGDLHTYSRTTPPRKLPRKSPRKCCAGICSIQHSISALRAITILRLLLRASCVDEFQFGFSDQFAKWSFKGICNRFCRVKIWAAISSFH